MTLFYLHFCSACKDNWGSKPHLAALIRKDRVKITSSNHYPKPEGVTRDRKHLRYLDSDMNLDSLFTFNPGRCTLSNCPNHHQFRSFPITASRVLVKRVLGIPHLQWSRERKEGAGWGDYWGSGGPVRGARCSSFIKLRFFFLSEENPT